MNKLLISALMLLSVNAYASIVCTITTSSCYTDVACDGQKISSDGKCSEHTLFLKQYVDKGFKIVSHVSTNTGFVWTLVKD